MHMLVHRHPTVAFRIGARAIELPRCLGEGDHQGIGLVAPSLGLKTGRIGRSLTLQGLRVRSAPWMRQGRMSQGRLRRGGLRNRGHRGTIGGRGLDVGDGHHNAGAHQWILAQPPD